MTDEEIYKIVMKVENQEKVRELAGDIEKAEQKLRQMIATNGAASIGARHYAEELGNLQTQMKQLQSESGMSGQKLMQLGNTLDDLQYVGEQGLRPIINNIMQLSPLLGVALIVIQQIYTHWDQLAGLFGQGHVKTQAEEMEELGKKTSKTADETARLAKLEMLRRNAEAQAGPTKEAAGREKAVNEAVVEAPYAEARKAVEEIHGKQFSNSIDQNLINERDRAKLGVDAASKEQADRNRFSDGNGDKNLAEKSAKLSDAQSKVDAAFNQLVTNFLAGLGQDPKQLAQFSDKLRETGRGELADKLVEAGKTPDEIEHEKAKEHADKVEMDWASKKAQAEEQLRTADEKNSADSDDHAARVEMDWASKKAEAEEKIRKEEEQKDKDEEEHARKREEEFNTRKATADEKNRTDTRDEAMKAGEELMKNRNKRGRDGKDEEHRMSRVIGAEGLSASIQSAVGKKDDSGERTVKELEKQTKFLEKMAAAKAAGNKVAFNGNGDLAVM